MWIEVIVCPSRRREAQITSTDELTGERLLLSLPIGTGRSLRLRLWLVSLGTRLLLLCLLRLDLGFCPLLDRHRQSLSRLCGFRLFPFNDQFGHGLRLILAVAAANQRQCGSSHASSACGGEKRSTAQAPGSSSLPIAPLSHAALQSEVARV